MRPLASLFLITLGIAGFLNVAGAQSKSPTPVISAQETPSDQSAQQSEAISDFGQKYVTAYNKGDAKAVASFYAQDVDYIDQDGEETKGRDEMEKLLATAFQANPGAKLEVAIDEVKQLAPDVLLSRGMATVTPVSGAAEATRFVAIRVRRGDHWEISQLTETAAPAPSAYSQLQQLEWLVGSWEDKSGDQTVEAKISWAGDRNFLVRTIKLKGDQAETDGWEIIGWDPERQQIRSWIFDSNGGFGESSWANDGEHWLIKASNVLPNGDRSTAENVLTKVGGDEFTWESQNRTLNGDLQPSLDKIDVHRVAQRP
jgi:uncharacterized protein (TIGR02246 family)